MKRLIPFVLVLGLGLQLATPAFARRVVVYNGYIGPRRTTVVVRRGWPLVRPARVVVVRPAVVAVRVEPRVYLRPVLWTSMAVAAATYPAADVLAWTDGATLAKNDDWTELTLNCDQRGRRLWYEVKDGEVQADWAEVVFANGETQVVDFAEHTQSPGLYPLLDFANGRRVDHVRMVARAKTDNASVALRLEK